MNIQIYTEVMNSQDRTDALMFMGDNVYVVEAKLDASSAREAIDKIDARGYAACFAGTEKRVVKLGLNFSSVTRTIKDWYMEI